MLNQFKRLFNQALVYGLGDTVNKLAALLLMPLFSRYLSPAEYGVLGILTVANTLLASIGDLGMSQGMIRYFREEETKHKLIGTAQYIIVSITLAVALIVWPFAAQISEIFFKTPEYAYIVRLNFFTLPLVVFTTSPMVAWRMDEKAKFYVLVNSSRVIIGFLAQILFIVGFHRGLNGLFEAMLLTAALFALIILATNAYARKFRFSREHFQKMFVFGFPFIFSAGFIWVINWADRFLLSRLSNLNEVGLYSIGYSIGMAVMLPIGAFNGAWTPFYMAIAKEPNAKKIYSLILTYFFLIMIFFALVISNFGRDYLNFFTPQQFHAAYIIIPIITLAYIFNGSFSITAIASFLAKKTYIDPFVELAAAAVNIGLIFVLIPLSGRLGAAWATLAAYIVMPALILAFTYKFYPIKYEYSRILRIFLVGGIVYYLITLVYAPTVVNLLLRIGILLCYPVILMSIGFFSKEEVSVLISMRKKITKK